MIRTQQLLVFLLAALCSHAATAQPGRRPNILIAIADDWSFPHASIHGSRWTKTPHFDRLAREGVLFNRAYTPVSKCSASRASLLNGRNPWQLEAGFTHWSFFPPQYKSYAEALAGAGYFAGFTGKGWSPGIARTADGADRHLLGKAFQQRKLTPPTSAISSNDYAANFADFLDAAPKDRPWTFWFGATEPHRAYEPGSGIEKGGKKLDDLDRVPGYWPDNETVRSDLLDYALEVEYFDSQLGRVLRTLEERGELDNTLVIVTSDNGMPFPRGKGQCYDTSNHLPLAIRFPPLIKAPGRTIDDYVSFIDLAPTILEAAGVGWAGSGMSPTPGRSLVPLLASMNSGQIDPARDHVLIGRERHDAGRPNNQGYPIRGIVQDDYLYLHNFAPARWPSGNPDTGYLDTDSSPIKSALIQARRAKGFDPHWEMNFGRRPDVEFYDLTADADCIENIAGRLNVAGRQILMRERMFSLLKQQGDPRLTGSNPDSFDAYPFANPDYNNLYERWKKGEASLPRWVNPADVEPAPLD